MKLRVISLCAILLGAGTYAQNNTPDLSTLDAYIADAIQKFDQPGLAVGIVKDGALLYSCLLYTSDAADERSSVDLGGRRIIKKTTNVPLQLSH